MANLEGIKVSAYIQQGTGESIEWKFVNSALTESDGTYDINGLRKGTYKIKFEDPSGTYQVEYYNNESTMDGGNVAVLWTSETMTDIDAVLASSAHLQGTVTDE